MQKTSAVGSRKEDHLGSPNPLLQQYLGAAPRGGGTSSVFLSSTVPSHMQRPQRPPPQIQKLTSAPTQLPVQGRESHHSSLNAPPYSERSSSMATSNDDGPRPKRNPPPPPTPLSPEIPPRENGVPLVSPIVSAAASTYGRTSGTSTSYAKREDSPAKVSTVILSPPVMPKDNSSSPSGSSPSRARSPKMDESESKDQAGGTESKDQSPSRPRAEFVRGSLEHSNTSASSIYNNGSLQAHDRLDHSAQRRLIELEKSITVHQNLHVKQRAALSVALDRAKYEAGQADFRLAEIQSTLQATRDALRQRINSRLDTLRQLRQDSVTTAEALIKGRIKPLPESQHLVEQSRLRMQQVETLEGMVEQLNQNVDTQILRLEMHLNDQALPYNERVAAALHLATHASGDNTANIRSMHMMLQTFFEQSKRELDKLAKERIDFEEDFRRRIQKMVDENPLQSQDQKPKAGKAPPSKKSKMTV